MLGSPVRWIIAGVETQVRIGIAAGADSSGPARTRAYLDAHTDLSVDVVDLPARGAPAFNLLASETEAAVLVLLEAGALVGPGWLDLLMAALRRPGCGLAGPSTNRAWNEQACARRGQPDLMAVRRDAAMLLERFGGTVRPLTPLHSLGDFCYAVRREVVEAIGGADEAYNQGPCWEMDYNIRAARAGFVGLWVCGAYVYRPPVNLAEARREAPLLARNRKLYQDRFCGLRLRHETDDYQGHCRGERCDHFAPAASITVAVPLPTGRPQKPTTASATTTASVPLASCLMPTRERPVFAAQAVEYFLAQDYPNRELVIIEDGPSRLGGRIPDDPRIRLVSTAASRSIGAMRNEACALARGEVLVLWDDDDWHGPGRVSRQVAPLLSGDADVTGLRDLTWLDVHAGRSWQLSPALHRRMLRHDVYGGTLAFRRDVWERLARFPDRSLAEDAYFLDRAIRRGARLAKVGGQDIYVYVRHGSNSWPVRCGQALDHTGWQQAANPVLPEDQLAFYGRLRPAGSHLPDKHSPPTLPRVSCIMPTADRRSFAATAIRYFLRQDYPAKELVIVDDGLESVEDLVPDGSEVRYHRLHRRLVLGAKRNLACELATGSLIAHWDDDDWQAPNRLSVQVAGLLESRADVCGMSSLLFYDPAGSRAWRYSWPSQRRLWAAGTSLCYPKALWTRSRFSEVATGEDTRFVWRSAVRSIADVRETNCIIALVHAGNSVPKTGSGSYWTAVPVDRVEAVLGDDAPSYRPGPR
jgi:glycosyltransferase involved in cell wall biosynthesis